MKKETIGIAEQRELIKITRDLSKLLTQEDLFEIIKVYKRVLDILESQEKYKSMTHEEMEV